MAYEMREHDGHAVVVDHNGKSIVDIAEQYDEELGAKVLTPVFTPDMAKEIASYLNAQEARRLAKALPDVKSLQDLSVRASNGVRSYCGVRAGDLTLEHVVKTSQAFPRPEISNVGKVAWKEIDALASHTLGTT